MIIALWETMNIFPSDQIRTAQETFLENFTFAFGFHLNSQA